MQKFQRFVPITKVDKDKQMVYGWASTPDLDSDGEIITLEAIKKALPEYLKFPTIREMHMPIAAGTTKEAEIRNSRKEKGLYIGVKVVAKDAWEKVQEGVYKGFSIGGHVLKRAKNLILELELVEISLVDVPANKAAKIEVWKKEKLIKDSMGITIYADLMNHIKGCIDYAEYMGKDAKGLRKMLEMVKAMIGSEAGEADPTPGKNAAQTVEYIKQRITQIEKIDLKGDKKANLIREGVIMAMKQKADELNKKEDSDPNATSDPANDEKAGENAGNQDENEQAGGSKASTTTVTETTEVEDTEVDLDADDEEENKEAATTPTLTKLDDINKKLDKVAPKAEKKTMDLAKTVNAIAGTLSKVADTLVSLEERVASIEKTPAATKSKNITVSRSMSAQDQEEDPKEVKKDSKNPELVAKKARLAELEKLYSTMPRAEFAKRGHSDEAQRLQSEIAQMEGKPL